MLTSPWTKVSWVMTNEHRREEGAGLKKSGAKEVEEVHN